MNAASAGTVANADLIKSSNTALLLLGSNVATKLPQLLAVAPELTKRLRGRAHAAGRELRVWWAVAGDWDVASIPGHSDRWPEVARSAALAGAEVLEIDAEPHWAQLPRGSATAAVALTHAAAPELPV
jgi:hypothetical protein